MIQNKQGGVVWSDATSSFAGVLLRRYLQMKECDLSIKNILKRYLQVKECEARTHSTLTHLKFEKVEITNYKIRVRNT